MMSLEKRDDGKQYFLSGKYEGVSLDEVLSQLDGRGWIINHVLYSGFKLFSDADAVIIERALNRRYINSQPSVLAECLVCGEAVPHNHHGCVLCQLAALEGN